MDKLCGRRAGGIVTLLLVRPLRFPFRELQFRASSLLIIDQRSLVLPPVKFMQSQDVQRIDVRRETLTNTPCRFLRTILLREVQGIKGLSTT